MQSDHALLRANLPKLALFQALSGSMIFISVIIPFYYANGLSLTQIFILQSVFSGSVLLWELPTGQVADRFGRRTAAIFGSLFCFLAILCYAMSSSFAGFLFAEMILAIGWSFTSGTVSALTYDTLLAIGEQSSYRKVMGRQQFFYFGGEAMSSILGGFLAMMHLRAPLWATLLPFGCAILVALTIEEAPHRNREEKVASIRSTWQNIMKIRPLRVILLLHAILSTMTLSLFWLTQPYQTMIGLPLMFYGVTHAVIVLAGAFATRSAHTMERWFDDRVLLLLIALTVTLCYIALSRVAAVWGLIFFLLGRTSWGFLSPLTDDVMNRLIPSATRATALSIKAFLSRLLFTIVSPILGFLADVLTLQEAMLIAGVTGAIAVSVALIATWPMWKQIPA
jgi:MFS family permease